MYTFDRTEELPLRREGLEAVQLHGEPDISTPTKPTRPSTHLDRGTHSEGHHRQSEPSTTSRGRAVDFISGMGYSVSRTPAAFVLGRGHTHFSPHTQRGTAAYNV